MSATDTPAYIGRFAPSPTGPLHIGSLLAALASYLDARAHQGRWLLRIEDTDPPREVPGAADSILRTLEAYGLQWDGEVVYQSRRHEHYQAVIQRLVDQADAYHCGCSRQEIAARGPVYDGYCRTRPQAANRPTAVRLQVAPQQITFDDLIQGPQQQQLHEEVGDFVILRKDRLFAYQLAVVVDDALQGITHVVRGSDLLDSTPRQIFLQRCLGYPHPVYAHIPILVNASGQKLSKQTFAPALPESAPGREIWHALTLLGQRPPDSLQGAAPAELLSWASRHWQREAIPHRLHLPPCTV